MALKIALVGRPNVGKSTIFNRFAGRKQAIVYDQPGVTRDWREAKMTAYDERITVLDTAGLTPFEKSQSIERRAYEKTLEATKSSDVILFVLDTRAGVLPEDKAFAKDVRKFDKPVILLANKSEARSDPATLADMHALGFGAPIEISAEHNIGFTDIYAALKPMLPKPDKNNGEGSALPVKDKPITLALIGRPNVGKSTLFNALIGQERVLTGPEAGLTRDAIAIDWVHKNQAFRLVDTAGLRKKAKVVEDVEGLSTGNTLNTLKFAHIVVLLIDVNQAFEKQDLALADLVLREGRGLVIALNKWDTVSNKDEMLEHMRYECARLLPQVKDIPLVTISALNVKGFPALLKAISKVHKQWMTEISTAKLNAWFQAAIDRNPPPVNKTGRRTRLKYITQTASHPPTFTTFLSNPKLVDTSYLRYLRNDLSKTFGLTSTPVRIRVKKSSNPYDKK